MRYWAFAANPKVYRIEDAVRERKWDTWTSKRRTASAGDRAVIWKLKGGGVRRGVVALAEVVSDPELIPDRENPYWVYPFAPNQPEERVVVRYVLPPGVPLWLDDEAPAAIRELSVSRATGGTVFKVTAEQWDALLEVVGGWPVEAPEIEDLRALVDDLAGRAGQGQGRRVSAAERQVIEAHAMGVAQAYYEAQGWSVRDVSKRQSYDLHCTRAGGAELRVEVKGTTGDGSQVLLTPGEVAHARQQFPRVALCILAGVELTMSDAAGPRAGGGQLEVIEPWRVDDGMLDPVGYVYTVGAALKRVS